MDGWSLDVLISAPSVYAGGNQLSTVIRTEPRFHFSTVW